MNAQSKYEMVKKLFNGTVNGSLQWEKTSQPNGFQISIKDYVLTTLKQGDEQDPECLLRIDNSDGDLVDEIIWSDLKELTTEEGQGQVILYRLYDVARYNAMGADKAIMEITNALDALPQKPNIPAPKTSVPPPKPSTPKPVQEDEDDVPF
jgi:hypothetical protein